MFVRHFQNQYQSVSQYMASEIAKTFESKLLKTEQPYLVSDSDNQVACIQLEIDTAEIIKQLEVRAKEVKQK